MNAPAINPHLLRLSILLELERRAREAPADELAYLMVNDTLQVMPYQQAALWRHDKLAAVSGVPSHDPAAPYCIWLRRCLAQAARRPERTPLPVSPELLGVDAVAWAEWFPSQALWLPLPDPRGGLLGGLLLGRQEPWHDAEIQVLSSLAGAYAQALAVCELPRRRRMRISRRRLAWVGGIAVLAALSLLPVRSSVLAPAEVVAETPLAVRAPFDGVVDAVHVTPNAPVHKGDRLVSLDTTERKAKADVAAKALEIARAEFTEASQLAMNDPRAKGRLPVLQSRVAQAELEYDYDRTMLARSDLRAAADGVAVFDDATQWIGRPVTLGERIMLVAPPRAAELDIAVPVAGVVTFAPDAAVSFFPNVSPDEPVRGHVVYAGYSSAPSADGVLSVTYRAHLDVPGDGLRLGLKGTAKIYGPDRPFILWVLRRPLAAIREWLPF